MKRLLIVLAVVAGLGTLFFFGLQRGSPDRVITSSMIGREVPAFRLPMHGNLISEHGSELEYVPAGFGKPVIINFWAEWCEPCRIEAPLLQQVWQEYGEDLTVIGIHTLDKGRQAAGRAFINEFGLTFPNVVDDDSRVGRNYGLFGVPETFFIDADGLLVEKYAGILSEEVLSEHIDRIMP